MSEREDRTNIIERKVIKTDREIPGHEVVSFDHVLAELNEQHSTLRYYKLLISGKIIFMFESGGLTGQQIRNGKKKIATWCNEWRLELCRWIHWKRCL